MTGQGSSCGACKFLRRKCTSECVFAPYFCYDEAADHFAAVHKVFGASNVSKLLLHLPMHNRSDAALTVAYEALARMQDPIYGCVAHIFALQQQVANLREEIEVLGNQMANHSVGSPSYGSLQATAYSNSKSQFTTQHDTKETLADQDQQVALPIHPEYKTEIQTVECQINEPLLASPPHIQQNQNSFCNFDPNPLQRNFEGVEPGIQIDYPWFETDSVAAAWEGLS
ncbi:hypothetical protein SLA2020_177600 [Shorea laevis]